MQKTAVLKTYLIISFGRIVTRDAYFSENQLNCCGVRNDDYDDNDGDGDDDDAGDDDDDDDKYNCVVGYRVILYIIVCWSVVKTEKRKGR